MLFDSPVLTSDVASSLPETGGDAATLVNPADTEALSLAIWALDQDAGLREELSQRGPERVALFSPKVYQKTIANVYKRFGAEPDPALCLKRFA